MLFVDEAPFDERVKGVSTFSRHFRAGALATRRDARFAIRPADPSVPLSPVVHDLHAEQLNSLPGPIRERFYRRLSEVLTGKDTPKKFKVSFGSRSTDRSPDSSRDENGPARGLDGFTDPVASSSAPRSRTELDAPSRTVISIRLLSPGGKTMWKAWALVTCGSIGVFGLTVITAEKPPDDYSKAMKGIGAAAENLTKAIRPGGFRRGDHECRGHRRCISRRQSTGPARPRTP